MNYILVYIIITQYPTNNINYMHRLIFIFLANVFI
jgi:hypothetical protein